MRLSDERYEEIKEEVADVYEELHITKFPVKCMEVCKGLSVYKGRIKQYEIDLDKPHHGMQPHVHHCNEKGYRLGRESDEKMRLTKKMKEKIRVVMETFSRHKEEMK